jgi:glycosyltransferase involved in cell wall biosynthesis
MADSKRLAFVPPRYGDEVVGGSEALMREAAHGLAGRGWEVEVLTTCARDHYTWANAYPPGEFVTGGLTVRRFPTVHDTDPMAADAVLRRILVGVPVSAEEELSWVTGFFRVPQLYHHLVAHGADYRAVILSPYLFWTTVVGATACPERTVVVPCLHDEAFAYLSIFRPVLADVAQVWFLSEPEHQLAHRLGPVAAEHSVVGCGVPIPAGYDPEGFRGRHGLGSRPFLLYAGRREALKGWDDLLRGYTTAVTRLGVDIDLVTVGVGTVDPPESVAGRVIDLGFLPEDEVAAAFAAAVAYIQPSPNESFSRTVMESWLAGTPVIASSAGAVVEWHCRRSGAGIVYRDDDELAECLALAADAPEQLTALGRRGRDYVLANYTWDAVLDRMEAALGTLP